LMLRWLAGCPPLQRLAFGAVLTRPVDDLLTGYRQISDYLPFVQLDPESSSDFSYQINRPRNSTVISGLRINRFSRWSVARVFASTFDTQIGCRVELDINTAQEFQGELPQEKLPVIIQELVDLGKEIAENGDIP